MVDAGHQTELRIWWDVLDRPPPSEGHVCLGWFVE